MLAAAPDTMAQQDTDQWWRERRMLARKLLDQGKFQTAYEVVRPAAPPANEILPGRCAFHVRLDRAALPRRSQDGALRISPLIDEGSTNPIVLARANYWRGRAAEARGDNDGMRAEL